MPRNGGGGYSLPEPPFVPGTVISSTEMNANFDDIADALTASVASDGQTPMSGALQLSVDGFVYATDADTGIKRPSANTQVVECGGVDVATFTPTGVALAVPVTVDGVTVEPPPIGAAMLWTGRTAPAMWVMPGTYSRAAYADLWTFAQAEIAAGSTFYGVGDGSTTFTVGSIAGRALVGVDASSAILSGMTKVGDTTGAATVALTEANLAAHTHTASVTDNGHRHLLNANETSGGTGSQPQSDNQAQVGHSYGNDFNYTQAGTVTDATVTRSSSATTGISVSNSSTGSGTAHANVQPSIAFNIIIYAGA